MNSWILIFLGGPVGGDLDLDGAYSSEAAAEAAIIATGAPYNYQACEVWGPPANVPGGSVSAQNVADGSWVAISSMITTNGNIKPVGYGTFASKSDALAWARLQNNPAGFNYGMVTATP